MVILQAAADFDDGRAKTVETQAIEDARQKQFAAKEEPEEEEEHVKPADGELEFQEEEEEHVVPPTGATEAATDATSAHSDSDSENDDQAEKPENAEKPEAPIIPQKLPETQPAAAVLSNSQAETMAAFPQTQLDATQEGQEAKKDSEEGKDLEAEKDNPEEEKDRETEAEAEAKKCLQPQESEGEKVPEAEKDQATGEGEKVPEAEKDQATGPKVVEGVVQPGLKEPVEQAMTPSGEANEKTVQKGQIKLSSFFKSNILDSAHAHMTAPSSSSIAPTAPSSVVPPADETPALWHLTQEKDPKDPAAKAIKKDKEAGKTAK